MFQENIENVGVFILHPENLICQEDLNPLFFDSGREVRIYGAGHPMIGTVLMLFFGLPSITRSLYAT